MKDAKGHGSDAHSSGVQQVGQHKRGDYLEIKLGGKKCLVQVAATAPGARLIGWRVNSGGEKIETETKTAIQHHLVVFRAEDVLRPMKMNNHYAELEPK